MKKFFSLLMIIFFIISISISVFAETTEQIIKNSYIEYFDNGSYLIITLSYDNESGSKSTSTKSGSKKAILCNSNDEALITFVLKATYTYTGSSATCTSASTSFTIHDSSWKVTASSATKSGRTATANFTAKEYLFGIPVDTENYVFSMSCSNTGVLS